MPWTVCPTCGGRTHVNTGDPAGFEDRHPELMETGIALRECSFCTAQLTVGDAVTVVNSIIQRSDQNTIPIGSSGAIVACSRTDAGHSVYRVQLDTGNTTYFLRGEIRHQRNGV
ncbi:hypothetical protein FHS27_006377 [Rhodopirellula rubra]|uniref:Uncharacterized protein n=1 Tax=Aporhodopirellula rubra TaxID=980271 RepID=A0A7W5E5E6_9BACT|nr:hypothetical protein [Aporhodopirellula rubra]